MDVMLIVFLMFDAFLVFVLYRMDQNDKKDPPNKEVFQKSDVEEIYNAGYRDALAKMRKNHQLKK